MSALSLPLSEETPEVATGSTMITSPMYAKKGEDGPLRLLAPALSARTRTGGRIALAGILSAQADDVIAAYAPWFAMSRWQTLEGWVLLAGTRLANRSPDRG